MQLLFLMIQQIGLIVAIAFTLTRLTMFHNLIDHKLDRWTIILVASGFSAVTFIMKLRLRRSVSKGPSPLHPA